MDLGDPESEVTTDKADKRGPSHTRCLVHQRVVFTGTMQFRGAAVPRAIREASLEVGGWRGRALRVYPRGESPPGK